MPQDRRLRLKHHSAKHQAEGQHPDLVSMGQHARGFLTAALVGAARHISGQSRGNHIPGVTIIPASPTTQGQDQPIPANRNQRGQHQGPSGRRQPGQRRSQATRPGRQPRRQRSWTIPAGRRPQLMFGKGDLSQVFSCLTQLWQDCPGAAIALCRFIAMHQRPSGPREDDYALDRARNSFTRLVRKATPNATSLASARDGIGEARASHDPKGLLTAQTTYLEEQYLRFVHDLSTDIGLRELAKQLIANADGLQAAGSEGRQAYPRIMAADVLLQLGDIMAANDQIAQGFSLIGRAYPNPELVKLGTLHA